jgi:hypothetical protein
MPILDGSPDLLKIVVRLIQDRQGVIETNLSWLEVVKVLFSQTYGESLCHLEI